MSVHETFEIYIFFETFQKVLKNFENFVIKKMSLLDEDTINTKFRILVKNSTGGVQWPPLATSLSVCI